MFRTTFDRNVLENVEKRFFVWVHMYTGIGLRMHNTQTAETGWWLGRYDKDKTPFEQKGTALV